MDQITPEQKKRLGSWAEQRDTLLRDISIYQTDLNAIKKNTIEAAQSYSDLENRICEKRGELAAIELAEERFRTSLPLDISALHVEKSTLQAEIETERASLKGIKNEKAAIAESIAPLLDLHNQLFGRISSMDAVAEHVKVILGENLNETKEFLALVKKAYEDMGLVNNDNAKLAGETLATLHAYLRKMSTPEVPDRIRPTNKVHNLKAS